MSDVTTDFSLKNLNISLEKILRLSTFIAERMVVIMKELDDPNSELIEDLFDKLDPEEKYTSDEKKLTIETFQDVSFDIVKDAKIILDEYPQFSKTIIKGDIELEKLENCNFLKEVWFGDTYEKSHLEGLVELEKDLIKQQEKSHRGTFVRTCEQTLKNISLSKNSSD
ncbi:hypothetical protein OAG24_00655 [bacterium]|nr:hypothetical protein [bacterium]